MRFRAYRAPGILLLALHIRGCATWRPSPVEPRQLIEQEMPPSIRIRTLDGREVLARDPRIVRETSFGAEETCRASSFSPTGAFCESSVVPVASLAEVEGVEVRRINPGRSVAVALGVTVFLGGVLLLILASEYEFGGLQPPS